MQSKHFSIKVNEALPLIEFLTKSLQGYSRNKIKSLLTHRQLWLNGDTLLAKHDYPLKVGDRIDVMSQRHTGNSKAFEHKLLKLIYEDDYIIVVDKKSGLLTVGTDTDKINTVYHILNQYMKTIRKDRRIYVVHRLDKNVSGLLVFAKSKEVQDTLQENWNKLVSERSYLAIVEGTMDQKEGQIKSYLTEDKQKRMHSSQTDNGGQLSVTNFKIIKTNRAYSFIKLNLETERKNQIRVHLKEFGFPISGDRKYGGSASPIKRLCLHAGILNFTHPVTNKPLKFESPLPIEFSRMI